MATQSNTVDADAVDLSATAIQAFLASLPEVALKAAPSTHLPTTLPLSFPSDLHCVNLLTVLHLLHTLFSQPQHRRYFAEADTTPSDTALRGALGMFLASETGWDNDNLLSAKAWREDLLNEAKVADLFDIEILKERQHETLPIKVGERSAPAVAVVADVVTLFHDLGYSIDASCIGEEVLALLTVEKEHTAQDVDQALAFAQDFCHRVVTLMPLLADPYPDPKGQVLPAAPLMLLQDLAHRFPSTPTIPLPPSAGLANISPLPLPIDLLLHLGIVQPDKLPGGDELRHATGDWWVGRQPDLFTQPDSATPAGAPPKIITVSRATLDALCNASVQACGEIASHAQFGAVAWQKGLTMVDVAHLMAGLDGVLDAHGMGVRIVL